MRKLSEIKREGGFRIVSISDFQAETKMATKLNFGEECVNYH